MQNFANNIFLLKAAESSSKRRRTSGTGKGDSIEDPSTKAKKIVMNVATLISQVDTMLKCVEVSPEWQWANNDSDLVKLKAAKDALSAGISPFALRMQTEKIDRVKEGMADHEFARKCQEVVDALQGPLKLCEVEKSKVMGKHELELKYA